MSGGVCPFLDKRGPEGHGARPIRSRLGRRMRSTKIVATIGPSSREPRRARADDPGRHGHGAAQLRPRRRRAEHAETAQLDSRRRRARGTRGGHPRGHSRARSCGSARWAATGWRSSAAARASCSPPTRWTAPRSASPWPGAASRSSWTTGDVLYLADGAVRLRVSHVTGADVVTQVEVGGSVASRQGLNLPNVTVSLPAVSDEDIALVDAGHRHGPRLLRALVRAPPRGPRAGARAPALARLGRSR